jgi:two-component system CheB/CheR fusion protein
VVKHLERELEHVKAQLREVVEQYETNTEELKASNEELQAMNEELRSTTEELETSREELQSINEELSTVNQELKSKVDELGHANSDLKNLMASTAIATLFIDREFRILRYTPPAVDIFHIIPGDVGRPIKDLRDRLLYPELLSDAARVLEQLVPIEREVGDQDGRWYLARLLPYRTEEDRIGGVVLTLVDISRRKGTELALRTSEERYRRLFNSIDEGFCVIEVIFNERKQAVDYRFIEVNPSFEKHTGLRNALGRTMRELVPDHEDYWFKVYGTVATTGQSVRFERFAEHLGRWYDVYAFRCSEPDRHVAILFTDITRKKASEQALAASQERLRLIVENAREFAIFSTDLDRNVTSWNTGAARLLGYAEEEIVGRSADIIFTDEDRAAGAPQEEADRSLRDGRAADERWHMRRDRSRLWGSGYMMNMRDSEGKTFGFVKILHDRTEAKRNEEELAQSRSRLEVALREAEHARAEAEAAGRTKDQFLATLSHELRTPLTPVMMTAESILKRKDLPPRIVDGLELICRNVEIQTHFIDDLLDVTRIARGKFEVIREPLNVHDAVRGALQICEGDISVKQQQLRVNLAAPDTQIVGDPPRVQQVFWNLLKNASKFTPDRGKITVESRNEGGDILVSVSDNGMGIDPTRLIDIFEAFRQGDTSITRRFGGLGLGLAIAKAAVEALGGSISASSQGKDRGATFTVRLPLAPKQSSRA